MWRVGTRTFRQYIGSNCWVAHSGTNCYYIKADENGNALPVFYVKSVEHPITFGEYELSIETMDGETGNIGCTRESTLPVTVSQRYIAYENDVSSALSAKADISALSSYLPLSGGQLNGVLSVGTGVQVFNEADGGVVTISDGSSNQTFYQHNKVGTPNGNLYFPVSIPEQDETIATQEYVGGVLSAYPQSNEISATRV